MNGNRHRNRACPFQQPGKKKRADDSAAQIAGYDRPGLLQNCKLKQAVRQPKHKAADNHGLAEGQIIPQRFVQETAKHIFFSTRHDKQVIQRGIRSFAGRPECDSKKNRQHKAWYERQKAAQPPKPRTLKELAAALDAGQPLTPEETERLEASRSRKKNAYQELKAQAETDPAAAAELARRRAYHSEATKKSRQKMYEEAAAGNPEAQARYENFLATRRENYHKKKQDEKGEQIA